jgi:RNA 2',3'-cyclic 3'-phosphodiesterase
MRLFLALDVHPNDKQSLNKWRDENLSLNAKLVNKENFHITLAFIGQIEGKKLEALKKDIQQRFSRILLPQQKKTLLLTDIGLFKKPKVLYLSLAEIPNWLHLLADTFQPLSTTPERPYCPHLTICRKVTEIPKCTPINYKLLINSFSLYESKSTLEGVTYTSLSSWEI